MARKFKTMERNGHTFVQVSIQRPNGEYTDPVWINARKTAGDITRQVRRMQEGQFDYMYSTPPQSPERTARVRRIGRLDDIFRSLYSGINVKGAKMVPADRQIVKTSEGVRYITDATGQKHIFNGLDPAAEGGKYTFALSNG